MPIRDEEEFELVPLSPIRRLEKRIEKLENTAGGVDVREFFRELIAIIRMNQEIVDELAKSSDALRVELAKLPAKIDEVIKNLNELISYIRAAATEEAMQIPPTVFQPLAEKLDQLIAANQKIIENNENISGLLESIEKKLKPPLPPKPPILRPIQR
ncbi:MAG: hypothetical protein QW818_00185 [Candidatus Aenigmatarchaeota archaeon]|nr:hypothetical protein [Candidatus Aenigmarchaeota archaeon]